MAQARTLVMPAGAKGTYHVLSRCTRREFLLGGKHEHRKEWAAQLLADLLSCFAIDLQAYAIMSNHVHLVLRPRPDLTEAWNRQQTIERGLSAFPIHIGTGTDHMPVTDALVADHARDGKTVARYCERLASITWLMKLFKQRLARRANREDGCTGHFWESRFLTIPLLDTPAVVACMAYVDRNPWRAGIVRRVEQSRFCTLTERLDMQRKLTDGELALNRHLVPLSRCAPIESWTGEPGTTRLRKADYMYLVDPSNDRRGDHAVHRKLGIDRGRWQELAESPGLFQGHGVGHQSARRAFAATQGKKTLANKTRIWAEN